MGRTSANASSGASSPGGPTAVQPRILYFAWDAANVCTLTGLFCALLAVAYAANGHLYAALVAVLWATNCDFLDGFIARRTTGRSDEHQLIGAQLDSLIDLVTSGVVPALILLTIGDFAPWLFPGAFAILAAGALRLSYFNVFSRAGDNHFTGLPVYYNPILISASLLLHGVISDAAMLATLHSVVVLVAIANVSSLRIPKQRGWGLIALITLTAVLSILFAGRLLSV